MNKNSSDHESAAAEAMATEHGDIQFFLCLAFAVRIDSFEINKCLGFLGNLGERS